jgi:hypothetical protein
MKNNKRNQINLSLYKSIIESDFFLLDKTITSNLNYISEIETFKKETNSTFGVLNIFQLIISMKQLIRLLQFLNLETKPVLYLTVADHYFILIEQYLKECNLNTLIKVQKEPLRVETSDLNTNMLLDLSPTNLSKGAVQQRLYFRGIFLIAQINSLLNYNKVGSYKVYNDTLKFNKILFLLALISTVLNLSKLK